MNGARPETVPPWWESERVRRSVIIFFAILLLIFAIVPVLHCLRGQSIKDYFVWYEAGRAVLLHRDVYPAPNVQKFPFMYPPPCAIFLAPLSALGQLALIVVLVGVNALSWITCAWLSMRLAARKRSRAQVLLSVVPNLLIIVYVWSNFLLGQPSLLLLALMLSAFVALQLRKNKTAGVLIALAAAIKAFPAIAIVYLVYRRFWVAAATLTLTLAFLLIVLPIPFRGFARAKQDLQRWSAGMLFKYDENGVAQRAGRSNSWRNQSIWGVANRMLRHIESDPGYGPHEAVYSNFADLEFATVNKIILGAALLLGLTFIFVLPSRGNRSGETDAIEFALLLLLMLMFTPLSFGYLFAWLLYPFTVVTERVLREVRSPLRWWAGAAVGLLALTIPFRVGAQTYGNTFAAALLLFLGLAAELRRVQKRATLPVPPTKEHA